MLSSEEMAYPGKNPHGYLYYNRHYPSGTELGRVAADEVYIALHAPVEAQKLPIREYRELHQRTKVAHDIARQVLMSEHALAPYVGTCQGVYLEATLGNNYMDILASTEQHPWVQRTRLKQLTTSRLVIHHARVDENGNQIRLSAERHARQIMRTVGALAYMLTHDVPNELAIVGPEIVQE